MPLSRQRLGIIKGKPLAAVRVAAGALENGQLVGQLSVPHRHQSGDPGGVIGAVRLKSAGLQGFLKGLALAEVVVNSIGLIAVGDDSPVPQHPHRSVDDERGVRQLGGVKGLGADALILLHKNTVAAVDAAAHDEVGDDAIVAAGALSQQDAPAGIGIVTKGLCQVQKFHPTVPPCC